MWATISRFTATRAATGWALALGVAAFSAAWYAYDYRGDQIADLKLALAVCQGSEQQAAIIDDLTKRLNEANQKKAENDIEALKALPDDCYSLDGPSPLERVRAPAQD